MLLASGPPLWGEAGKESGQCATFHTHAGMGKRLAPSDLEALPAVKLGRREEAPAWVWSRERT